MNAMLSIIIPVYPNMSFLPRCIDSIKKQTYRDIEIIIVTDGVVEKTDDYLRSLYSDLDIKFIHHSCNKGTFAARFTGIKQAKGRYITFIDADDEITKDTLSNCIKKMQDGFEIVGFAFHNAKKDVEINEYLLKDKKAIMRLFYMKKSRGFCHVVHYVYDRKLFDKIMVHLESLKDEYLIWGEDTVLFFLLMSVADSFYQNQHLGCYIYHKDNINSTTRCKVKSDIRFKNIKTCDKFMAKYAQENNITKEDVGFSKAKNLDLSKFESE